MAATLDLLEQRIQTLEDLVGHSDKIEKIKGYDTLLDINSRLSKYLSENSKISNSLTNLNEIQRYNNFQVLDEIEDEHLVKAKMELILGEETYIRKINKDFENLQTLSKILDNKSLNDISSHMEKLKDVCANHAIIKEREESHTTELKQFLADYFTTMQSISETMENLNAYLD